MEPFKSCPARMKYADLTRLTGQACTLIGESKIPDEKLAHHANKVAECRSLVVDLSGEKTENQFTRLKLDAHKLRCRKNRSFQSYADGQLESTDPQKVKAAQEIEFLLNMHTRQEMKTGSYAKASHHTNAFLADVTKPNYMECIKKLGMEQHLAEVQEAQREFERIEIEQAKAAESKSPELSEQVKILKHEYEMLVSYIRCSYHLDPKTYAPVADPLSRLHAEISSNVKSLRTRRRNEAKKEEAGNGSVEENVNSDAGTDENENINGESDTDITATADEQ